jgi:hypothetical protein
MAVTYGNGNRNTGTYRPPARRTSSAPLNVTMTPTGGTTPTVRRNTAPTNALGQAYQQMLGETTQPRTGTRADGSTYTLSTPTAQSRLDAQRALFGSGAFTGHGDMQLFSPGPGPWSPGGGGGGGGASTRPATT